MWFDDLEEDRIFEALGNRRRREMLAVISQLRPTSAELAKRFDDCSWPALSRHLRVLLEARLVHREDVTGPRTQLVTNFDALARVRRRVAGLMDTEPKQGTEECPF